MCVGKICLRRLLKLDFKLQVFYEMVEFVDIVANDSCGRRFEFLLKVELPSKMETIVCKEWSKISSSGLRIVICKFRC